MDVAKKVLLAYLEEDNEEKVFFRLLPLLDEDGVVREEAVKQWPAQGGLRIVPDRNEQYHFKDRMRTLGSFCLLDLTPFPVEANKIRTNKNFNPDRGEVNQYIVYSDTIKALPDDLCYQIIEGAQWQEAAASSVTPQCYVKLESQWYGPISKNVTELPEACDPLDEDMIFAVECPDGVQRSFYWPPRKAAETPDSEAEEVLEVGKSLTILDETKTFDDQLKDIAQPLSSTANFLHTQPSAIKHEEHPTPQLTGTPLYRSGATKPAGVKAHNLLHQVVESQWRAAKYEAPSAQLKQGADWRHVENPVDYCREALNKAWASETAQDQIVDCVLQLPGMTHRMEKVLFKAAGEHPLQGAVKLEMQELEAERLTLLVQLDKAREDLNAYREEAVSQLSLNQRNALEQSKKELADVQKRVSELKEELNALSGQKEALEKAVESWQTQKLPAAMVAVMEQARYLVPLNNAPLRLKLRSGSAIPVETLIRKLTQSLPLTHDEAVNWLILLALCPRVQFAQRKLGDSLLFIKTFVRALGLQDCLAVQEGEHQQPLMCAEVPSATPALLATSYLQPLCPDELVRTAWMTETARAGLASTAYKTAPWPVVEAPAISWEAPVITPSEPVSMESLKSLLKPRTAMSQPEKAFMDSISKACASIRSAPAASAFEAMAVYLKSAAPLMKGGFAAACDFACRQWLIPLALEHRELAEALRPVLAGLPCAHLLEKQ
ncbi:MAG: hypothetical protein IJF65_04975 [Clostridia bacterium]|nr:hypothetical protein [Clostridia bacterium]